MTATIWLQKLREGDRAAANLLFQKYASELGDYAKRQVWGVVQRVANHEDLIQEVFLSFLVRFEQGDFENVKDSSSLRALLIAITQRRAINQNLHWTRDVRGGGRVRGDSALAKFDPTSPDPVEFIEQQTEDLINFLGDPLLQEIAVLKLDGYTQHEIAERLDVTRSMVVRKLERIRKTWRQQFSEAGPPEVEPE